MADTEDQWKLDGNCEICRRESYCKHLCTAARNAMMRHIRKQILERIGEKMQSENKE